MLANQVACDTQRHEVIRIPITTGAFALGMRKVHARPFSGFLQDEVIALLAFTSGSHVDAVADQALLFAVQSNTPCKSARSLTTK